MFVAGTTSEFRALEDAEGLALIETVPAGAAPEHVIAHVGAPHARRPAAAAAAYGPAEPAEVMAYYREIATAADDAELYA